jgi:hypothetical protein
VPGLRTSRPERWRQRCLRERLLMNYFYQYRSIFIIGGVAMLMGLLLGIGVVRLLNPSVLSDADQLSPTPTASPIQAAGGSTDRQSPAGTSPAPTTTTQETSAPTSSPTSVPTPTPSEQPTAPPTAAPPAQPTATPATAPTATPVPAATTVPTPAQRSAAALLDQVADAEAALRSGHFEATLDYGGGSRSSAAVRFDLGDEQQMPRLHLTTTYEGAEEVQTTERITIGDTTWERQLDGSWTRVAAQTVVWDQVQPFLPHAAAAANPRLEQDGDRAVLHWEDAGRNADVTLVVDPATGMPRELRRVTRETGEVLTVTYTGWNTQVEITPPEGT